MKNSTDGSFVPLKTRATPKQVRAQIRITEILDATSKLLGDHDPHKVSALMIAKSASIPVSSIYRYFPVVEDIFEELYFQTTEAVKTDVFAIYSDPITYPGWRDRLHGALSVLRTYFEHHPYYARLLQSHVSRTGLETTDDKSSDSMSRFLAEHWKNGGDGFTGGDPAIVSNVTMIIFLGVENFLASQRDHEDTSAYFAALSLNLETYLAHYLSDDRTSQ